jgi:prolipoprotein diacylglyceryltransferase
MAMSYPVGLTAAIAATVATCHVRGVEVGRGLDRLACGLAAAHAIAALGGLAVGCCFGKIAPPGTPWAVAFGQDTVAWHELAAHGVVSLRAPLTPPLYPVQAIEALAMAACTVVLVVAARRPRGGALLGIYLLAAAVTTLALAPWRVNGASVVEVTCLAAAGIALTLKRYVDSHGTLAAGGARAGRLR